MSDYHKWIKTKNEINDQYVLVPPNLDFLISFLPSAFDSKGAETAIVTPDENYYILEGDWRHDYEKIIHRGIGSCLDFYHQNIEFNSTYSQVQDETLRTN